MLMLLMKMTVLALGGHLLGDIIIVTLDSPALCVIETPTDEEETQGHWPLAGAVRTVSQKEGRVFIFSQSGLSFSIYNRGKGTFSRWAA